MYAIVDIAGQQFKVEKNQKIFVHRLDEKEGSKVDFDRVLLIDNDKDVLIGEPVIQGAVISGKILSHPKGDKVKVFKKKRRKGYKKMNGHRQYLTEVLIEDIIEKGGTKKTAAIKTAPAKEETASKPAAAKRTTPEKKEATKTATATAAKKPVAKKPVAKKPAVKKAAVKKPGTEQDSK